jgi:uncharacterized SAM-binding protein YcdF (DUF218 family)
MKSLVIAFLMPPGIAILCSLLVLYFLLRMKRKATVFFLTLSIVLGWMFSTEAVGRLLTTGLIAQVNHRQDMTPKDAEILVVLTAGMRYTGKEAGWLPEMESFQRLAAGMEVHQKLNSRTPILVSGGKTAGPHYPSESSVLKERFDKDNARILPFILEEISINTYENALQSAHIIRDRGASRVLLVTSEEHMLRALAAFRGRGIDPLPLRVYTMSRGPLSWKDYLPSYRGIKTNASALYEIYAIMDYLISDHIRLDDLFYKQK